jgi:hypothetical protein
MTDINKGDVEHMASGNKSKLEKELTLYAFQ